MRVGIGLPNPVPGCPGPLLPQWATAAEERGFSSVATIDRVAFPSHDSMVSLGVAAAVTSNIGLLTNILVLPTRNAVLIAKEAATVAAVSGGRFTLGIGVGGREDDFTATDTRYVDRGRRTDTMIETMLAAWRGEPVAGSPEPVVPEVPGGSIPLLIGGYGEPGVQRAVRVGIGWTAGGMPPDQVGPIAEQVRSAWRDAGRSGEPRVVALAYYSLGAEAEEASLGYLRRYYSYLGEYVEAVATGALRSAEAIKGGLAAYADAGVDELILDPTVADIEQLHRLADIAL